ncbi:MAG TPA: hypothetical protein VMV48_04035 [Gallionellaceae bacterium]|nr:hypothetical protein [Gallionellaceae bacterium]
MRKVAQAQLVTATANEALDDKIDHSQLNRSQPPAEKSSDGEKIRSGSSWRPCRTTDGFDSAMEP